MPNDENMDVENIDEELIENESSQEEQDGQEERQLTQEDIDNAVKSRVGRVERKAKRQLAEKDREIERYKQLESTIRAGLGASDDEDILEKVNSFYKEQGVDIPKYESKFNNRDLERLGESDAQDLISSAEFDEIQSRANELASLKQNNKISKREEAEFMQLGNYLSSELKLKELKDKGVEDKAFKEFSKKFNSDTSITDIYDLYEKLNHKEVEKPASTGSIKSTVGESKVKKYYTSEEVDKLTSKDLDNPTIFKNVMASMKKWGK